MSAAFCFQLRLCRCSFVILSTILQNESFAHNIQNDILSLYDFVVQVMCTTFVIVK